MRYRPRGGMFAGKLTPKLRRILRLRSKAALGNGSRTVSHDANAWVITKCSTRFNDAAVASSGTSLAPLVDTFQDHSLRWSSDSGDSEGKTSPPGVLQPRLGKFTGPIPHGRLPNADIGDGVNDVNDKKLFGRAGLAEPENRAADSSCSDENSSLQQQRQPFLKLMESNEWHAENNETFDEDIILTELEDEGKGAGNMFKVFLVPKRLLLVVVQPPTRLRLLGRAVLSVLHGAVEVEGHLVTPDASQGEGRLIESGFLCGPTHLRPVQLQQHVNHKWSMQLRRRLARAEVADAWSAIKSYLGEGLSASVLLLEKAAGHWPIEVAGGDAGILLPRLKGMGAELGFRLGLHHTNIWQPWRESARVLAQQLAQAYSDQELLPRVVVCGRQNSGKSTLLRMLVNTLLNTKCPEVMYLDCDPGQCEFTPSAALSLVRVTKPLFGPPFTHVRTPEKMYFLGHVSPVSQPDTYSSAVLSLLEHCRQNFPEAPLVVNTMGWVCGMGMSLLVDVIRWTRPTNLVQLTPKNLPADATELPLLDPEKLNLACGWLSTKSTSEVPMQFMCHHLPGGLWRARSRARIKREVMMLSYLSRNVGCCATSSPFWLWSSTPYRVPWSSLAVHECSNTVLKQDLLRVINGSMVALCIVPESSLLETENPCYPKFVKGSGPYECLGYGLVRAVDPVEQVFYIFTPEPIDRLKQVNALVRGDLHLPDAVLFRQAQMFRRRDVPYVVKSSPPLGEDEDELVDDSNEEEGEEEC